MSETKMISGLYVGPIIVTSAFNTLNVKAGADVIFGGDPAGLPIAATVLEDLNNPHAVHDNIYNIKGKILGMTAGVLVTGARDQVTIGATGSVYGVIGVAAAGAHSVITNNGRVVSTLGQGGTSIGLLCAGTGSEVFNNDFISGGYGVVLTSDKVHAVNGKDGEIYANDIGVLVQQSTVSSHDDIKFVNHGLVRSLDSAVFQSSDTDANVTVNNNGTMVGKVVFGDGNDTLDNRDGTLTGNNVTGGKGDDTLIVDDHRHVLIEKAGQGDDTVKSTVSYALSANVENLILLGRDNIEATGTTLGNHLFGNAGDNILSGGGGGDLLDGGTGNDILRGGGGIDQFVFATGYGKDKAADFANGTDTVNLSGWAAIRNFNALMNHAEAHGDDLWITASIDVLVLNHVKANDLHAASFMF